jgi:hypothetical protein
LSRGTDSGATGRWDGIGEHILEVFQLLHSRHDSELHLVGSVATFNLPAKLAQRERLAGSQAGSSNTLLMN